MKTRTKTLTDNGRDSQRRGETKSLIARGLDQQAACKITGYRDRPGERLSPDPKTGWIPTPAEILAEAQKIRSEWPDALEPSGVVLAGIRKNRDTRAARCGRVVPMRSFAVDRRFEDE